VVRDDHPREPYVVVPIDAMWRLTTSRIGRDRFALAVIGLFYR
jgi:hypothetical protein